MAYVAGGYISQARGTKKTAAMALFLFGCCCLISPFIFLQDSEVIFIIFLILWGFMVVGDSSLFSTLVASQAAVESRGTALTIVNSIGFAVTVVSIQLVTVLLTEIDIFYVLPILVLGPAFGLWSLF